MVDLTGKVAIVTGAGSGIGRTSALIYAREGAKVVVADIDEKGGQETIKMIQKVNGDTFFVKTNLANSMECESLVKKTIQNYGHLDIACNNTGMRQWQNLTADYYIEGWQKVIAILLSGLFFCMKFEIPEMLKVGGGAIVNMAAIPGQAGSSEEVGFITAKRGVIGLTKNAAIKYAAQGIRVNSIGPDYIKTPIVTALDEHTEIFNGAVIPHPISHTEGSEKVAELVVWLSSNQASLFSGAYYSVNTDYLLP
jgi:NAD(P)-dependent dehydrogenase (short-subunit alcohol dehydrogenase family)